MIHRRVCYCSPALVGVESIGELSTLPLGGLSFVTSVPSISCCMQDAAFLEAKATHCVSAAADLLLLQTQPALGPNVWVVVGYIPALTCANPTVCVCCCRPGSANPAPIMSKLWAECHLQNRCCPCLIESTVWACLSLLQAWHGQPWSHSVWAVDRAPFVEQKPPKVSSLCLFVCLLVCSSAEGLANPGPIMSELWTDEELEAAVVLDGVVAVVDGRNVGRQLAEARQGGAANEAQLQVALADVILLNKVRLGIERKG